MRWRSEEGSAAAELAILGPLFCLILAGLIEGASLVQTVNVVRNAAREGARYAAISDADPQGKALAYLSATMGVHSNITLPAASAITVSDLGVGNAVTVTVPVTVRMSAPVIQNILGASIPVSASATMRRLAQ